MSRDADTGSSNDASASPSHAGLDGDIDGTIDGADDGCGDGDTVGIIVNVGELVGLGEDGVADGDAVGAGDVGVRLGLALGLSVVGATDGAWVGAAVGTMWQSASNASSSQLQCPEALTVPWPLHVVASEYKQCRSIRGRDPGRGRKPSRHDLHLPCPPTHAGSHPMAQKHCPSCVTLPRPLHVVASLYSQSAPFDPASHPAALGVDVGAGVVGDCAPAVPSRLTSRQISSQ